MTAVHVLDTSALAKLVLDEPHAPAFQAWFTKALEGGARCLAPSLIAYELAAVLWSRVPAKARSGTHWTRDLVRDMLAPLEMDEDAWARIDPWMDRLSAYDAAYLGLAVARDATLVTYHGPLAAAARKEVPVISPGTDG